MKASILIIAIAALLGADPARGHLVATPKCESMKCRLVSQQQNLSHAKYVAKRGGGQNRIWAKQAVGWLTKELNETKAVLSKKKMPYIDSCLRGIIALENRTMDPTLDYGGGHGNVYEAYGIPQANPGYKMRSAGPDWRTNPATQIKWMYSYVNARYGSSCAAYHHRINNGYY